MAKGDTHIYTGDVSGETTENILAPSGTTVVIKNATIGAFANDYEDVLLYSHDSSSGESVDTAGASYISIYNSQTTSSLKDISIYITDTVGLQLYVSTDASATYTIVGVEV